MPWPTWLAPLLAAVTLMAPALPLMGQMGPSRWPPRPPRGWSSRGRGRRRCLHRDHRRFDGGGPGDAEDTADAAEDAAILAIRPVGRRLLTRFASIGQLASGASPARFFAAVY